jgi:hypothetical protein
MVSMFFEPYTTKRPKSDDAYQICEIRTGVLKMHFQYAFPAGNGDAGQAMLYGGKNFLLFTQYS